MQREKVHVVEARSAILLARDAVRFFESSRRGVSRGFLTCMHFFIRMQLLHMHEFLGFPLGQNNGESMPRNRFTVIGMVFLRRAADAACLHNSLDV